MGCTLCYWGYETFRVYVDVPVSWTIRPLVIGSLQCRQSRWLLLTSTYWNPAELLPFQPSHLLAKVFHTHVYMNSVQRINLPDRVIRILLKDVLYQHYIDYATSNEVKVQLHAAKWKGLWMKYFWFRYCSGIRLKVLRKTTRKLSLSGTRHGLGIPRCAADFALTGSYSIRHDSSLYPNVVRDFRKLTIERADWCPEICWFLLVSSSSWREQMGMCIPMEFSQKHPEPYSVNILALHEWVRFQIILSNKCKYLAY